MGSRNDNVEACALIERPVSNDGKRRCRDEYSRSNHESDSCPSATPSSSTISIPWSR
jgi:hypothetical protein